MAKNNGKGCGICRLISSFMTLALIAAGGYAAWFFMGKPNLDELSEIGKGLADDLEERFGDLTGALENFTGFSPELWDEDPYVGNNTTNLWDGFTRGNGGLKLELWNALDESWTNEYVEAVKDWNEWCDVKVLELTSERVEIEHACSHKNGVMKVCNGNYDETGWLGINEVMKLQASGIITSSIAKMNEYYLLNADFDERLYTMCHELGHGYGLPHTDENFNNRDQGNCLDYTNTPSNNIRPGTANCNRLLSMYGSVDGTISASEFNAKSNNETRFLRYNTNVEKEDEDSLMDDADYYYEYGRAEYSKSDYDEAMRDFHYELAAGNLMQDSDIEDLEVDEKRGKWRRLTQHARGGHFARALNEDYVLELHVLYPNPERDYN
mmetsp:Transcript_20565/g.42340  ORF Transcript_20565/g.42340 Transcript_20565/m.42340 type:complete len:381 (+) Transcript_20565:212-1354(+)